jgi:hypothetical protein
MYFAWKVMNLRERASWRGYEREEEDRVVWKRVVIVWMMNWGVSCHWEPR